MPNRDAAGIPDGQELLPTMGWESLPYGCLGLVRKTDLDQIRTAWSWLIVIPWASDAKPWIDGTKVIKSSVQSEGEQRRVVLDHMRKVLDDRYGEAVGQHAAEDLIKRLQDGD